MIRANDFARHICFSILGLVALSSNSQALTLDDFESGIQGLQVSNGGSEFSSATAPSSVGGFRKLEVETFSGGSFSTTTTVVEFGELSHSQDSNTTGLSVIRWDGSGEASFDPLGLQGVDLTQDGGDALRVIIEDFDFPNANPVNIRFDLYGGSTGAGSSASTATLTLSQQIVSSTTFDIPFSSFASAGFGGGVDFSNIGAISIEVNGRSVEAVDIVLSWFGTNGGCDRIPTSGSSVVDECGVCGGDGTTCLDCSGVPNGPSELDRCGVCEGDGQSCLECEFLDIRATQTKLDGGAKKQEKLIKRIGKRLRQLAPDSQTTAFVQKNRKVTHELQLTNWSLAWQLPSDIQTCSNTTFCAQVSNLPILEEYRINSEQLRKIARRSIARIKRALGGNLGKDKRFLKDAERLHATNMELADTVPISVSSCS